MLEQRDGKNARDKLERIHPMNRLGTGRNRGRGPVALLPRCGIRHRRHPVGRRRVHGTIGVDQTIR